LIQRDASLAGKMPAPQNHRCDQIVNFSGECMKRTRRMKLFLLGISAAALSIFVAGSFATPRSFAHPAAPAQESAVTTETVHFDSGGFQIDAFLANPSGAGKHPAVLVIHDSLGLDDSMREITKRFAGAGFVALAPDFTSRRGGARTPEQMAQAVAQLTPNLTMEDAHSAMDYLQKDVVVDAARISAVGFGWGGWRSFMLATSTPELFRAVIYSGTTSTQNIDAVHAKVLAHYAQYDFRTTGNALVTEKAMAEAGKHFTYFVYPQVYRTFYAPGAQYNSAAAQLAWSRTLDFLQK
jgi:carboxymethylenebutenolidase